MDIQFYGANCITLSTKHARVTIDDTVADLGGKSAAKLDDIALFTGVHASPTVKPKIMIDQPGEYEVSGVSIYAIQTRGHLDEAKEKNATMFKLVVDDVKVLVTGHVYPELTDAQLEKIGMVDVMFVPVGGNGYTLDPIGALKLIKKVEPKIVIPTHYSQSGLQYSVPQQDLEQALKGLSMEPSETVAKLKVKPGEFAEGLQLIVLEKS
jgi:L-ascorbate metabolism protein UlaG (beta-lactamase superfamily)